MIFNTAYDDFMHKWVWSKIKAYIVVDVNKQPKG